MSRHVVCSADELPPGARRTAFIDGREIALFNVDGRLHALLNRCPHGGARICTGVITGIAQSSGPGDYRLERNGEFLRCPWHGWEFELATGQSWCAPSTFCVNIRSRRCTTRGPRCERGCPQAA